LIHQNRAISGEGPSLSPIDARGKRVIILGGGDTGSDCLGTALRQGAAEVLQFELMPEPPATRATQTPWPHWPLQLRFSHAHEEGGRREWSFSTERFEGENGQVKRLMGRRLDWNEGRPCPTGTPHHFEADLVILALGFFGPEDSPLLKESSIRTDAQGRVAIDTNDMTSLQGVFAAGDIHRGASLIVWAIAEGRRMAKSVSAYLERRSMQIPPMHAISTITATEEHA
jgi:glutamate synthase (NADPH/NADH) small chain